MEKQEGNQWDEEQRKLLTSLLTSGPEAAAKTLKAKLTASSSAAGLLDAFVQFLFASSDSIKLETALVYCLWLSCGGTNPNSVIQKIKANSAGKSNACGRVWKSGDLAYNCADCQFDDTCAICVDCFRAGNHEGHDFSLIHVGGGCCDCGDPQAWQPKGFCEHHKGASEDDDPTETLPILVKMASHVTFRSVLKYWLTLLDRHHPAHRLAHIELNSEEREAKEEPSEEDSKKDEEEEQEEREKSAKAVLVLNWFAKMIEHFGDGTRRVICEEIDGLSHATTILKRLALRKRKWAKPDATQDQESQAEAAAVVDVDSAEQVKMTTLLLEIDFVLPSELSKGMNGFYFSLLGDAFYKRKFAFYFTKSYVSFIDQKLENALTPKGDKVTRRARRGDTEKYENLLSLTVQIFTVPNIVPSLVQEGNLLDVIIGKLLSVFKTYVFKQVPHPSPNPDEPPRSVHVLDTDSRVLKKRAYWHLIYDLRSILQIKSVPKWLVYTAASKSSSSRLLEQLVEAWGLLAGMDRNVREVGTHIEFESEQWLDSFTLEMHFNESSEGGQSVEDVRRVVSSFTAAIEAWFATEPSSADVKAVDSEVPQLLKYDVATQGVSLHLPLHRALGGVLAEACKEWGFSMIDLLRINDKDPLRLLPFVSALLEGPLRAQVLAAQVRSNLWVRNGQSMAHKVSLLHENVQTFEIFDLDIALMQSCATLCNSLASSGEASGFRDFFVTAIVHRFGLLDFFDWTTANGSQKTTKGESGEDEQAAILRRLSRFFRAKRARGAAAAPMEHETEEGEGVDNESSEFGWMRGVPRQQKLALAEQCLRLLIILANERGIVGRHPALTDVYPRLHDRDVLHRRDASAEEREEDVRDYIKSEIVHRLCTSPATHSQLVKSLPNRLTKAEGEEKSYLGAVDGILKEVAVFYRPEGKKQGMFRLKDELWATAFDPYFPHYSKQKLEKAYENYTEQFQNKNRGSSRAVPIVCPRFRPISAAFEGGVAEILASPFVLRIVFSVLYQAVQQKRQQRGESAATTSTAVGAQDGTAGSAKYGRTSEGLFNEALHLLLLALQWRARDALASGEATMHEAGSAQDRRQAHQAETMHDLRFGAGKEDLVPNLCLQFMIKKGAETEREKKGREGEAKDEEKKEKGKEREGMDVVVDERPQPAVEGEHLESILGFVVELAVEGETQFEEQHDTLQAILALVEKCDTTGDATHLLHALRTKMEERKRVKRSEEKDDQRKQQAEGAHEGESLRDRKMREAKERQKAIMAKFAAQQKKVMEKFEQESEKEKEKEEKGKEKDKGDDLASIGEKKGGGEGGEVCVFCRESDSDEKPLCLVAFVQRTNRLAHARKQSSRVWRKHVDRRYLGATDEAEGPKSEVDKKKKERKEKTESEGGEGKEAEALEEVMENMDVEDRGEGAEHMEEEGGGEGEEEEEEEEEEEGISLEDARRLAEHEGGEEEDEEAEEGESFGQGSEDEDAEEIFFGESERVDELIAEEGLEDEDEDEDEAEEYDEDEEDEAVGQEQVQHAVMQLIEDYNRQRDQVSGVHEMQQPAEDQPAGSTLPKGSEVGTSKPVREKAAKDTRRQFFGQWLGTLQQSSEKFYEMPSNAFSTSCGHYMHATCRHDYCVTQLKSVLTDPVSVLLSPLDIAKGEFACPLCRSVGNALIPLAAPPSSPARYERVPVPERQQAEQGFDAWVEKNVQEERVKTTESESVATEKSESESDAATTVAHRKGFRDTMADFVSRIYGAAMGLSPEEVALPAPYLTPFAYALFPSLIASTELVLRPSIPALTLPSSSDSADQAFTADYAVDRWEALRSLIEGSERRREAEYLRTVMTSLFYLEASSSSTSPSPSSDALFAIRKLIFGGIPRQGEGAESSSDQGGGKPVDAARILSELRRCVGVDDDDDGEMQPFLNTDMFSLFVPAVLMQRNRPDRTGVEALDHLIRLLLTGTVLQALVAILQQMVDKKHAQGNDDQSGKRHESETGTVLDKTLRKVVDIMKRAMIASALSGPSSSSPSSSLSSSFSPALSSLSFLDEIHAISGPQLEIEVKRLCLPFLYRVVLFQHFCLARPLNLGGKEVREEEDEFVALLGLLALPSSLEDLLSPLVQSPADGAEPCGLAGLAAEWLTDFFAFHAERKKRCQEDEDDGEEEERSKTGVTFPLPSDPLLAPALPFELDRSALPNMYQNLQFFKSAERQRCNICETSPRQPALCLLCGEFVCFAARCCAGEEGSGECNVHALHCGAGEGMFLLLKETAVVIVRYSITGCFYSSPYLDVHGEEDSGLKRGRPLYLDMDRYQALRDVWLGHQISNVISKERSGQAATAFSLIQWHRM